MSTRFTFQIVRGGGSHFDETGKEYVAGESIVTSDNLMEKFPGKFMLVATNNVAPVTPALDKVPEGVAPVVTTGAAAIAEPPAADGKRTIVPPKGVKLTAKSKGKFKFDVLRSDTGEVIASMVTKRTANDLIRGEPVEV